MAAEGVHLPEAVLRGDEALGEDEVVERGGAEVGDAVGVALDGDGSGEAGNGDGAVELGEGVVHGLAEPVAGGDEADDGEEDDQGGEDDGDAAEEAAASGLPRGFLGSERLVGNYVSGGEVGEIHGLIASVNGAMGEGGNESAAAIAVKFGLLKAHVSAGEQESVEGLDQEACFCHCRPHRTPRLQSNVETG